MNLGAWARPGVAWVALALVAGALSLVSLAWQAEAARWAWDRALLGDQPWRWATGLVTHWTVAHASANALGAAVLAALGGRAGLPARAALAWALAAPLGQALLGAHPGLVQVAGLSGWLHAGVVVAVAHLLQQSGRDRWVGAAIGLGLLLKLGLEQPWGPALRHEPVWGAMAIAPWAHAAGALAGAGATAALSVLGRRHRRAPAR